MGVFVLLYLMVQKNFVVYSSSAGSGKTFTLVKEYLKLALSDDAPRPLADKKILAVTFTNKADAEMKMRIIEALKQISENTDKGKLLINLLCDEIGINQDVLQKRARLTLSEILHNYSDFSISTIDSFTHKIVNWDYQDPNVLKNAVSTNNPKVSGEEDDSE